MFLRSLAGLAAALFLPGCDFQRSTSAEQLKEFQNNSRFVTLLPGQQIKLGDKPTTAGTLVEDLKSTMGDRKPEQVLVVITTSPPVPREDSVAVRKILQDAGFTRTQVVKVGLISEQ